MKIERTASKYITLILVFLSILYKIHVASYIFQTITTMSIEQYINNIIKASKSIKQIGFSYNLHQYKSRIITCVHSYYLDSALYIQYNHILKNDIKIRLQKFLLT